MKRELKLITMLFLMGLAAIFVTGCVEDTAPEADMEEEEYDPMIDPANFVEVIDNPYFPLIPGTTFIYEGETEDGFERNEVFVTDETRVVMGVTTTVVLDRVWEEGELIEETYDWYAQDNEGNVWYFGEDSREIEDGEIVSTEGSWESGVDSAKPGIVMKADPQIGDSYRQEYYKGEAEDMGEVVSLTESVTVEYGSFENVLKTREWTPLEPDVEENKFYVSGVGQIKEMEVMGGSGQLELIDITTEAEMEEEMEDGEYDPMIDPANFVTVIDNPYFPLEPGTTYIYEGEGDGETIRVESTVTDETRVVMGVTTVVVSVLEYEDGELAEETFDWYAQDKGGNVWYFGEDTKEIDDGEVVSTEGSWEAGVDGAKPGIIMPADPKVGEVYYQEFYEGEAEDMGEVISLSESVSVEYGSYDNCLLIKEFTPLEPGVEEYDYYCEGIGPVLEEVVKGGDERIELVEIITE